jgi:hypothetical protein
VVTETLARIDSIISTLGLIGETADNDAAECCCFQDVRQPDTWCHRLVFAEWWQEQTGETATELEAAQSRVELQHRARL